eukprot:scaffold120091_cov70-Phaeocystis_antarctica.AAC.1
MVYAIEAAAPSAPAAAGPGAAAAAAAAAAPPSRSRTGWRGSRGGPRRRPEGCEEGCEKGCSRDAVRGVVRGCSTSKLRGCSTSLSKPTPYSLLLTAYYLPPYGSGGRRRRCTAGGPYAGRAARAIPPGRTAAAAPPRRAAAWRRSAPLGSPAALVDWASRSESPPGGAAGSSGLLPSSSSRAPTPSCSLCSLETSACERSVRPERNSHAAWDCQATISKELSEAARVSLGSRLSMFDGRLLAARHAPPPCPPRPVEVLRSSAVGLRAALGPRGPEGLPLAALGLPRGVDSLGECEAAAGGGLSGARSWMLDRKSIAWECSRSVASSVWCDSESVAHEQIMCAMEACRRAESTEPAPVWRACKLSAKGDSRRRVRKRSRGGTVCDFCEAERRPPNCGPRRQRATRRPARCSRESLTCSFASHPVFGVLH